MTTRPSRCPIWPPARRTTGVLCPGRWPISRGTATCGASRPPARRSRLRQRRDGTGRHSSLCAGRADYRHQLVDRAGRHGSRRQPALESQRWRRKDHDGRRESLELCRIDVHSQRRSTVPLVDARTSRGRRLYERFRLRAVLGIRSPPGVPQPIESGQHRPRNTTWKTAADVESRAGAGRTTAGAPVCRARRSTLRRQAHSGYASRTAKTACRSTRFCCRQHGI